MAHVVDHLSVSALGQRYRSRAVLVAGRLHRSPSPGVAQTLAAHPSVPTSARAQI